MKGIFLNFKKQPFNPVIHMSNFMLWWWLIMFELNKYHIKVNSLVEFSFDWSKLVRIGSQISMLCQWCDVGVMCTSRRNVYSDVQWTSRVIKYTSVYLDSYLRSCVLHLVCRYQLTCTVLTYALYRVPR